LGKNYFSSEFITLNTRLFTWDSEEGWDSIPFLNLGLLVRGGPEAKRSGQTDHSKIEALGQMHDDFVVGAEFRGVASCIFISNWKDLLKRTVRNLFGPKELGGLGAHPIPGMKGTSFLGYSWRQLLIATLLKDGKFNLPASGIAARYASYEIAYAQSRFPNVKKFREAELPPLPQGYRWDDVTELVENTAAAFRTRVSWLAPAGDTERPLRDVWKRARKYSTWRMYKSSALMSLDQYIDWPRESKLHYRKVFDHYLEESQNYGFSFDNDIEEYELFGESKKFQAYMEGSDAA